MTIYTTALGKGGSTKTTTAAEITAQLAARGRRVLAIDMDEQGNLTTRLGVLADMPVAAVAADVILGTATAQQAAIPSPCLPSAWVLAGTDDLAELQYRPEAITALRDYLPGLTDRWDDVVIDTPPAMGIATLAALAAADVIIAPVACEGEAYDQLERLDAIITGRINPRLRPGQRINWIIPTRANPQRCLDRDVLHTLHTHYPGRVTPAVREAIIVRDSYLDGKPVSCYAPGHPVTDDYHKALTPVLKEA